MKIGDLFYRDNFLKDGWKFKDTFEWYMVYQKDRTFIFVDYRTQKISAILKPLP